MKKLVTSAAMLLVLGTSACSNPTEPESKPEAQIRYFDEYPDARVGCQTAKLDYEYAVLSRPFLDYDDLWAGDPELAAKRTAYQQACSGLMTGDF